MFGQPYQYQDGGGAPGGAPPAAPYGGGYAGGGGFDRGRGGYRGGFRGGFDGGGRGRGGGWGGRPHDGRCKFFSKMGACRHQENCGDLHYKPETSPTVLLPMMYANPKAISAVMDDHGRPRNVTFDEGHLQKHVDKFCSDVWELLMDFGPILEMKICENLCDHLLGNVYVKFEASSYAAKAVAGLQRKKYNDIILLPELSPVLDFNDAQCKEHDGHDHSCSRGTGCNFLHVARITPKVMEKIHKKQAKLKRKMEKKLAKSGGGADTFENVQRGRSNSPKRTKRSRSRSATPERHDRDEERERRHKEKRERKDDREDRHDRDRDRDGRRDRDRDDRRDRERDDRRDRDRGDRRDRDRDHHRRDDKDRRDERRRSPRDRYDDRRDDRRGGDRYDDRRDRDRDYDRRERDRYDDRRDRDRDRYGDDRRREDRGGGGGGDGGAGLVCHTCGQSGHRGKDCPLIRQ